MQKVFCLSWVTYECTQVTPSSEFLSTTVRQTAAPSAVMGISRPDGKVLSTRYLGMLRSSRVVVDGTIRGYEEPSGQESGNLPNLGSGVTYIAGGACRERLSRLRSSTTLRALAEALRCRRRS